MRKPLRLHPSRLRAEPPEPQTSLPPFSLLPGHAFASAPAPVETETEKAPDVHPAPRHPATDQDPARVRHPPALSDAQVRRGDRGVRRRVAWALQSAPPRRPLPRPRLRWPVSEPFRVQGALPVPARRREGVRARGDGDRERRAAPAQRALQGRVRVPGVRGGEGVAGERVCEAYTAVLEEAEGRKEGE